MILMTQMILGSGELLVRRFDEPEETSRADELSGRFEESMFVALVELPANRGYSCPR